MCCHSLDTEPLSLRAVISGLRSLVLWMSNSLELLHFIQFQLPGLLEWRSRKDQGQEDGHEGNEHNLGQTPVEVFHLSVIQNISLTDYVCFSVLEVHLSCVRSAVEETMAVLEEVIMLAFQQCVYYITKVSFVVKSSEVE